MSNKKLITLDGLLIKDKSKKDHYSQIFSHNDILYCSLHNKYTNKNKKKPENDNGKIRLLTEYDYGYSSNFIFLKYTPVENLYNLSLKANVYTNVLNNITVNLYKDNEFFETKNNEIYINNDGYYNIFSNILLRTKVDSNIIFSVLTDKNKAITTMDGKFLQPNKLNTFHVNSIFYAKKNTRIRIILNSELDNMVYILNWGINIIKL